MEQGNLETLLEKTLVVPDCHELLADGLKMELVSIAVAESWRDTSRNLLRLK
jgi:hypothetical protein